VALLGQEDIAVPPPIPGASVQRVVYELARELSDRYDITICSLPHPTIGEGMHEGLRFVRVRSESDERLKRASAEVIRVIRRLDLPYRPVWALPYYGRGYAGKGLRRLAAGNPQIVHMQSASQFLPIARRAVPDAKLVLHMHGNWLVELPRDVVRRRLRHADLIIGVSEFVAGETRNAFPELADRCRCVYNGVDPSAFTERDGLPSDLSLLAEAERSRLGLGNGPVALYVGALAPDVKGFEVLLDAWHRVLVEFPDAKLVVAGGGLIRYSAVDAPPTREARREQRQRFRDYPALVARMEAALGSAVVRAGNIPYDRLPAYYSLADVVAIPSICDEALSLPALEASSCGVPVVASSRGGLKESVLDGVTGTLVESGDPDALAHGLVGIFRDPALARRYGRAGRERVLREFTWHVQAERLANLYDELLSNGRPG
jgi:glycosyltransferase involved in cell wall biosynthesis